MIDNTDLQNILLSATDISTVCEVYGSDAAPGVDGFDPNDALGCFAAVSGVSFMGVDYQPLVRRFGAIKRTITKEANTASVEFSNLDRQISEFEFGHSFEGLVLVIRLISRSQSDSLDTSQTLFAGRCDKPAGGKSESVTVNAKFIINALDVTVPRRKFTPEDQEGRVASDPEFEGFQFMPQYGSITYQRREKKGGFLGLWNKKWVRHTMQYSSYSNLDASKSVPEVLGRAQIQSVLIGAVDVGTVVETVNAWCEGEISGFQNVRSTDPNFPLSTTSYSEHLGKIGTANGHTPGYVADAYYSRTAIVRVDANNSAVDVTDEAPDIVGIVLGRILPTPDGAGVWSTIAWSNIAAAHTRFLITTPDYGKLDESWIDDDYFADAFNFDNEQIFNAGISDFIFVEEG